MRKAILTLVGLVALLSIGCVSLSVHPLYDADQLVFDENLLGIWKHTVNPDEIWTFHRG